ncbi:hypothetical protein [Sunxiuqinia dokdonensis]|nr:hypothetical protein [Sunxiuqinia dokdonensis]
MREMLTWWLLIRMPKIKGVDMIGQMILRPVRSVCSALRSQASVKMKDACFVFASQAAFRFDQVVFLISLGVAQLF